MIKIGINGFGRIGRAIFRVLQKKDNMRVVAINDIDPLIENHAYLVNYDTIYGQLEEKIIVDSSKNIFLNDAHEISFFSENKIHHVPWSDANTDLVIESSGIYENVVNAHKIIKKEVKKVIVTHSPSDFIDQTIIMAANEDAYLPHKHNVLSSSICDANACAPVMKVLDDELGLLDGFITTLHPWLGYQNLVDSSLKSVSSPGHYWKDFALGRSSVDSLIPKQTTLMPAIKKALPELDQNIQAMSFRVPTSIVSASDMTLTLKNSTSENNLITFFKDLEKRFPNVILTNEESLVSIDFKGISQSCIVDLRWLKLINKNKIKIVLWYDNEWGYSNRAVDVAALSMKS